MLQFKPVRFHLQKPLVAREFCGRVGVRRQRQARRGVGFNLFDQILHRFSFRFQAPSCKLLSMLTKAQFYTRAVAPVSKPANAGAPGTARV